MKKLLLLTLSLAALSACKKNNDNTPATPSNTDLLVAKSWRVTAQTYTVSSAVLNGGNPLTTDIYAAYYATPCRADNFVTFNSNNTLVADEGALKCSPTDPQTKSGTWSFNSDKTKLTMVDPSQGGTPIPFDIITLSATTLHLRNTTVTNGGVAVTNINELTLTAR